jgi:hypothetical protein
MNRYAMIFIKSGFMFGAAMVGTFFATSWTLATTAAASAIAGILFGSSMALILYMADRKLRSRGIDLPNANVFQERVVELAGSREEISAGIDRALGDLKASILPSEPGNEKILARVPWSWKSFGEVLSIEIKPGESAKHQVRVSSRPRLKTTIVDYGKNAENVRLFCKNLVDPKDSRSG